MFLRNCRIEIYAFALQVAGGGGFLSYSSSKFELNADGFDRLINYYVDVWINDFGFSLAVGCVFFFLFLFVIKLFGLNPKKNFLI